MFAFLAGLPTWIFVVAGIIIGYLVYRYWKYKKATAYGPKITRLESLDFRSDRDNPPGNGH